MCIDKNHTRLSVRRQCTLLSFVRSGLYYQPVGESAENLRFMRLVPIYQTPNTSKKHAKHKVYPYLLGKLNINKPNQVWCTDITYIPMRKGFLYLVAVMDWYSRKVLSWRLSSTMEVEFCTKVLKEADVKISMDGRGRWIDNRMTERLWRSLKYECVYVRAFETDQQAKRDIGNWMTDYNTERPHSTQAY